MDFIQKGILFLQPNFSKLIMRCDVISSAICLLNQPQYLVVYDRYEKSCKRNYTVILKDLSNEAIITMENFSLHKHIKDGYYTVAIHNDHQRLSQI